MFDPGHTTTTSINANQIVHFARRVGLEVSLASSGLSENFLLPARGVGCWEVRGQPWGSSVSGVFESTLPPSVAFQSNHSLSTRSGSTSSNPSQCAVQTVEVQQSIFADQPRGSPWVAAIAATGWRIYQFEAVSDKLSSESYISKYRPTSFSNATEVKGRVLPVKLFTLHSNVNGNDKVQFELTSNFIIRRGKRWKTMSVLNNAVSNFFLPSNGG